MRYVSVALDLICIDWSGSLDNNRSSSADSETGGESANRPNVTRTRMQGNFRIDFKSRFKSVL